MFRIGFDPILEAEQRHEAIIKDIEVYRVANLADECGKAKNRNSIKLLAMLGRSMANLGTNLELRYGDKQEKMADLSQQNTSPDRS